jgi:hypothetical protein
MTDIKKAWNQFKKDIKKEGLDLTGSCYLTAKQLANRTATILICNNIPYADEIKYTTAAIQKVCEFDTWTAEEKVRAIARDTEQIAKYTESLIKYGTKENEYKQTVEFILNSKAWNAFTTAVGTKVSTGYEEKEERLMYLRINY